MSFDPKTQLVEGAKILDPIMVSAGFQFSVDGAANGSGGPFAFGSYVRQDRRLELHYRWMLGVVVWHMGQHSLNHKDYMRLLGVYRDSRWVGTRMDRTLDGFHRLAYDLGHFCQDFIAGTGDGFRELAERFAADPGMFNGFKALGR